MVMVMGLVMVVRGGRGERSEGMDEGMICKWMNSFQWLGFIGVMLAR